MSGHHSKDRTVVTYKYSLDIESVTHKIVGRYKVVKTKEMSHLCYSMHTNVVFTEREHKVIHCMFHALSQYIFDVMTVDNSLSTRITTRRIGIFFMFFFLSRIIYLYVFLFCYVFL